MNEPRFAGKTVMITGAGGGFGAAAARRFANEGANLLLSDIDKPQLDKLIAKLTDCDINFAAKAIDVAIEKEVLSHIEHGISRFGKIDVAINNAGIGQVLEPLHHTKLEDFERIMAVNLRGVFLCMKHQLKVMVPQESGAILNVASAAGLIGAGQMATYAASKHAVVGLTRSAADEVARLGIRVNALCPSFAPTKLFDDIADSLAEQHKTNRQSAYDRMTGRIPMRRLASVDEVVQAMVWACDPANSFMTGQSVSIDGGLTAV